MTVANANEFEEMNLPLFETKRALETSTILVHEYSET